MPTCSSNRYTVCVGCAPTDSQYLLLFVLKMRWIVADHALDAGKVEGYVLVAIVACIQRGCMCGALDQRGHTWCGVIVADAFNVLAIPGAPCICYVQPVVMC